MKYRGVTLIFVTHQLGQVRSLCDRALWLDRGEVQAVGDPVRVVDHYLQEVSAPALAGAPIVSTGAAIAPPLQEAIEVPSAARAELTEEERWGSGEVVLSRVVLVDDRSRELVALGPGTPVSIDIDVQVRVPQDDFVFGIGIYHADGTCVYGTNTDLEGLLAERLEADGTVRFVIPSLDLVAGSYRLDAAVHTRNGRAFDYRRGVLRFVVGSRIHDIGIYRPQHVWKFGGGVSFRVVDNLQRDVPAPIAEYLRQNEKPSGKKKR